MDSEITNRYECDLHVHSIRSACGFHSLLEIVTIMREKGIKGFALTDHGPALDTPRAHFAVLLKRIPQFIDGIRIFKGIEASILSVEGDLDLPEFEGYKYEAIIASLHMHDLFSVSQGVNDNTRAFINAMRKNPSIKVITHPYTIPHPVDIDAVTDVALETNTALEVNNSHIALKKANKDVLFRMLELAAEKGTKLAVNSDGHVFTEMGEFDSALKIMAPYDIGSLNIVNRTYESTIKFLGLDR